MQGESGRFYLNALSQIINSSCWGDYTSYRWPAACRGTTSGLFASLCRHPQGQELPQLMGNLLGNIWITLYPGLDFFLCENEGCLRSASATCGAAVFNTPSGSHMQRRPSPPTPLSHRQSKHTRMGEVCLHPSCGQTRWYRQTMEGCLQSQKY